MDDSHEVYSLVERFAIKKSGDSGGATHPRLRGREEVSCLILTRNEARS